MLCSCILSDAFETLVGTDSDGSCNCFGARSEDLATESLVELELELCAVLYTFKIVVFLYLEVLGANAGVLFFSFTSFRSVQFPEAWLIKTLVTEWPEFCSVSLYRPMG